MQSTEPAKLTGILRNKIVMEWIRRGKPGEYEDFVKAVCEAKGLEYTPPIKIHRPMSHRIRRKKKVDEEI